MCVEIGVWTLLALCLTLITSQTLPLEECLICTSVKKNQFAKKRSPKEQSCDLNEVTKRQSTERLQPFFQPRFQGVFSFQHPERGRRKEKPLKRYWNETELSFFM